MGCVGTGRACVSFTVFQNGSNNVSSDYDAVAEFSSSTQLVINATAVWLDGTVGRGPGTSVARFNGLGYLGNLAVAVPMGVSLYALSLLTLVGNAMVLHAIRTERRLQTVSNMFIMSLAVADLTVGLIVMPVSSAYAITGDWRFGIVLCQFWLAADYTASTASILNLLILSLDRYWSIRSPLKYIRKRTKRRALVMIGFVWLISSMWILPIIGWHRLNNQGERKQPDDVCETEFADNFLFKLTASTANFYIPIVLMMVLYAKIFYEIKKRSKLEIGQCSRVDDGKLSRNSSKASLAGSKLERQYSTSDHYNNDQSLSRQSSAEQRYNRLTVMTVKPPDDKKSQTQYYQGITVNIEYVEEEDGCSDDQDSPRSEPARVNSTKRRANKTPRSVTICPCVTKQRENKGRDQVEMREPRPCSLRFTNSIQRSNLAALRLRVTRKNFATNLRQEKKAARQLGVIVGAFILCWLPYMVTFIVTAYCELCISAEVHTATIWLGYLNSAMNPFLYALCNRNFKRAFRNMIRRGSKTRLFVSTSAVNNRTERLFA